MPKAKISPAFEVFKTLHVWPSSPGHVTRVARLLNLIDCAPILLRSKDEDDIAAGTNLAGSLIACYAVTDNWHMVVLTLSFIGHLDGEFDSEVAHWATAEKWKFSRKCTVPLEWRPQILAALDGPFFRNSLDVQLQQRLSDIDKKHPDVETNEAESAWKERRKINVVFDMADEFGKAIIKNADCCSQLAIDLGMTSWIEKLYGSKYGKDILAGCYFSTVIPMAHAYAAEWERLCSAFETIGNLEIISDHNYVFTSATSMRACYGHPGSLQLIPKRYHRRIRDALELPFFENHFDSDHFEIEVLARDRHFFAEERGKGFASRLLKAIPEIRQRYESGTKSYGPRTPAQYIICQSVIVPEARAALKRNDTEFFKILALFLETLIEEDWDLTDVYGGSVIAEIFHNKRIAAAMEPHVGKRLGEAIRVRDRN
ncbi:MAG: hypothetical protein ABIV13_07130 [Fimbriimonadales bacterium]